MISLAITRKQMYPKSEPSKDYENEVVYPEVSVDGVQAEKMGAPDLSTDEVVKATVKFKVKRIVKTEADGKTSYSMTLCITGIDPEMEADEDDDDADLEGEELPEMNATHALGAAQEDDGY